MQKWKKIVLITTILFMLLGGFFGFVLGESGVGGIQVVGKTDIFDCIMFSFAMLVILLVIYDLYKIYNGKKRFGTARFSVVIKRKKQLKTVYILQIICTVFEFVMFIVSHELKILSLGIMLLFVVLMYAVRNSIKNGIGENGIFHWGVLHDWNNIKSYLLEEDNLLKIKVCDKVFGFKLNNEIKLVIDREEKHDIVNFLNQMIMVSDETVLV